MESINRHSNKDNISISNNDMKSTIFTNNSKNERFIIKRDLNANYKISVYIKSSIESEPVQATKSIPDSTQSTKDKTESKGSQVIVKEESIVIEVNHKSFKWRGFKGEFTNTSLNKGNSPWVEDSLKEKCEIITSFLSENLTKEHLQSCFKEEKSKCSLTIPYAVGKKHRDIVIHIEEDKDINKIDIIQKLKLCEEEKAATMIRYNKYIERSANMTKCHDEIRHLINSLEKLEVNESV